MRGNKTELAKKAGYTDRSSIAKIESGSIDLTSTKIKALAHALDVSPAYLMGWETGDKHKAYDYNSHFSVVSETNIPYKVTLDPLRIPVLGKVVAGVPLEAVQDVIDYEEIPAKMVHGDDEYFGLQIKGDSMAPRILEGDVVIVRKQSDIESGDIAIVLVNGDDATVKRVKKNPSGMTLEGFNPSFEAIFYTSDEIEDLPVEIIGKVVELRGKLQGRCYYTNCLNETLKGES